MIGLSIGSFLNVILWRLPRNESIIYPNSYCPKCQNKILWKDNIPLISWAFLKGRCRFCNQKINFQYPSVELLTGLLFIFATYTSPKIYELLPYNYSIFLSWMIITICIPLFIFDIKYFWLPKSIIKFGTLFGLIFISGYSLYFNNFLFLSHIIAGTVGFLIFYFINVIGKSIYRKNVIGSGDIKLMFMFGLWLGIRGILISTYLSFLLTGLTSIFFIIFRVLKRNQIIPFGPFLISSSLSVWFLGNQFFLDIYHYLINTMIAKSS